MRENLDIRYKQKFYIILSIHCLFRGVFDIGNDCKESISIFNTDNDCNEHIPEDVEIGRRIEQEVRNGDLETLQANLCKLHCSRKENPQNNL